MIRDVIESELLYNGNLIQIVQDNPLLYDTNHLDKRTEANFSSLLIDVYWMLMSSN